MAKQLLFSVTREDCELQTFTVGGNGGSGKDTSNTGVRWIHKPSGATGESREERSQQSNKIAAWKRMAKSKEFKRWAFIEAAKRAGQPSVSDLVDASMRPELLKIETRGDHGWERID